MRAAPFTTTCFLIQIKGVCFIDSSSDGLLLVAHRGFESHEFAGFCYIMPIMFCKKRILSVQKIIDNQPHLTDIFLAFIINKLLGLGQYIDKELEVFLSFTNTASLQSAILQVQHEPFPVLL